MATYRVFLPSGKPADEAVFVREGFSAPAAAFSVLWALWNHMWIAAVVIFAFLAAFAVIGDVFKLNDGFFIVAEFAAGLLLGFEADTLRSWTLVRAGYREAGIVMGGNIEEAELRYFMAAPSNSMIQHHEVMRRRPEPTHDALGLFGTA